MTSNTLRLGAAEWGLLLVLSLLWGGSFLFGRIAVQEVPPMTVAFFRVAIAAVILGAALWVSRQPLPRGLAAWAPFAVMGLVNNVIPFSLIFWGQREIGVGLAAILNATTPLFAALLAHFFTSDEKLKANRLAGVGIGIAGVVVLVGPELLGGLGQHMLPQLAVLAAAGSYGIAALWGRRFRTVPPMVTCAQLTSSTVILLPLSLLFDGAITGDLPGRTTIAAILGLAVLCTALAYVIFFTLIRRAGASNVMLVTLLIPVSAMALGAVFLGEQVAPIDLAGAAIIGVALIVIDGRMANWLARRLFAVKRIDGS